jgi:hypothetical protein
MEFSPWRVEPRLTCRRILLRSDRREGVNERDARQLGRACGLPWHASPASNALARLPAASGATIIALVGKDRPHSVLSCQESAGLANLAAARCRSSDQSPLRPLKRPNRLVDKEWRAAEGSAPEWESCS